MAVVTGSWLVDALLLVVTLLYAIYRFLAKNNDYFEVRGIPFQKPVPILGNVEMFTKNSIDQSHSLYNSFPGEKFFGIFRVSTPTLVVKDPELLHRVLVKDFAHFHDQGFGSIEGDILSMNLFSLKGNAWRVLRNKLSPTFTSGKLKLMFDQFVTVGDHLLDNIVQSLSEDMIDAKAKCVDFGTEVIASTAFGLDFSRGKPQTEQFIQMSNKQFVTGIRAIICAFFISAAPKLLKVFGMSLHPKETTKYIINLVKATKEYRKKHNVKRNDYFQLLMDLQEAEENGNVTESPPSDYIEDYTNNKDHEQRYTKNQSETKLMTDEYMAAQTMVFLVAGAESVTSTLSFTLYHIAKEAEVQEKATKEVDTILARHGGWTYQAIKEMAYLDMILQETLRYYPLVPISLRECTLAYRIPDTDIVLEKGTVVCIPVRALHMDPKYHPDPEVFNPDRFTDNFHKPNPTYIPFGDGPRMCIGMRFALVEMKVCLAKILSRFSMTVNKKTQEPITFDRASFTPAPVGGIWLNFQKRNKKST